MIKDEIFLVDGIVIPCIGCTDTCDPEKCERLEKWIEILAEKESKQDIEVHTLEPK